MEPPGVRNLMACPDCTRQFDASGRAAGSRFRCLCGRPLTVTRPRPHDAAVIRCSACGAPRQQGAASCSFCGSDFTLHERDLHTICPSCMARVSDRARYCHHCATPLVPQPLGPDSSSSCPVCGERATLASRQLGQERLAALECPRCAGLWLARDAFTVLLDRARQRGAPAATAAGSPPPTADHQRGPLYRPCPECGKLMNRQNYGRRSGVIVDRCGPHGIWFDARELEALLRWVRRGGEAAAAERQHEERRALERQRRLARDLGSDTTELPVAQDGAWLLDGLAGLLGRWLG